MSDKKDAKKVTISSGGYSSERITVNSAPQEVQKGYNPTRVTQNTTSLKEGYNPTRMVDMSNASPQPGVATYNPADKTITQNGKVVKKLD